MQRDEQSVELLEALRLALNEPEFPPGLIPEEQAHLAIAVSAMALLVGIMTHELTPAVLVAVAAFLAIWKHTPRPKWRKRAASILSRYDPVNRDRHASLLRQLKQGQASKADVHLWMEEEGEGLKNGQL